MQIILCEEIRKLGKAGDVIKVKDGYARNFLIPQKKAYPATPENLQKIEREKKRRAALEQQLKIQAEESAGRLQGLSVTVAVEVNDLEKLYGSVTATDIVKALEAEGHQIDKKMVILEKPIEELGIYEVQIVLHKEVRVPIRVWVTKK